MRVKRGFLYTGVFLVAVGGVLVAANLTTVDTATLTQALRLWPLALVAIGLGVVARRTEVGLPAGMLAAAAPGLLLGGALAVAPRFAVDCGAGAPGQPVVTERGSFDGPATVSMASGCGSIVVHTAPGSGWQVEAADTAGRAPNVVASARSLSIDARGDASLRDFDGGRDTWNVTLPTSELADVSLVVHAGRSDADLAGARIGRLALEASAAEMVVDASTASIDELSGEVNVGSLAIQLPADSDLVGSFEVGAGELRVCTPPGVGMRLTATGDAMQVSVGGVHQRGSLWQSADYASATHRADISVSVDFGAVEIDPIGGCR